MARAAAAVAILCVASLTGHAQLPGGPAPESRQVTIHGRVVADDTGAPLPNTRLAIGGVENFGARVVVPVDEQGRFSYTPPKGPYRFTVSKAGYASQQILSARSGPPNEIRLYRAATISGRVMDDLGQPIVSARVSLHPWSDRPIPFTEVATADTDDRGEFRLGGVAEGTYVVGVGNMPVARVLTEVATLGSSPGLAGCTTLPPTSPSRDSRCRFDRAMSAPISIS
jgi:hypothetical protein